MPAQCIICFLRVNWNIKNSFFPLACGCPQHFKWVMDSERTFCSAGCGCSIHPLCLGPSVVLQEQPRPLCACPQWGSARFSRHKLQKRRGNLLEGFPCGKPAWGQAEAGEGCLGMAVLSLCQLPAQGCTLGLVKFHVVGDWQGGVSTEFNRSSFSRAVGSGWSEGFGAAGQGCPPVALM